MGLVDERSSNPLKQVLDLLGESVPCKRYSQWVLYTPEGATFPVVADRQTYVDTIERQAGANAAAQFRALEAAMAPLQRGAALFPAAAIRSDPGVLLTAARFFGPELLALGLVANQLTVREGAGGGGGRWWCLGVGLDYQQRCVLLSKVE